MHTLPYVKYTTGPCLSGRQRQLGVESIQRAGPALDLQVLHSVENSLIYCCVLRQGTLPIFLHKASQARKYSGLVFFLLSFSWSRSFFFSFFFFQVSLKLEVRRREVKGISFQAVSHFVGDHNSHSMNVRNGILARDQREGRILSIIVGDQVIANIYVPYMYYAMEGGSRSSPG